MANSTSLELATAANRNPAPAHYIEIDYAERHWAPSIVGRVAALNSANAKKWNNSNHCAPISIPQYVLYRWRFVMADALRHAFDIFGGAVAQINNLLIIMQIAIIENPNIVMLYDEDSVTDSPHMPESGSFRRLFPLAFDAPSRYVADCSSACR